ncbi:MAG: carboxylating nicotinate-nucleotide diphosphorylase [Clostridiales bacterium]|nr:carboxylating nicotinate-nucleotide diphosphorylase [Clostridiales bacterium]
MNKLFIEDIIKNGLKEDINYMDMATDLLIDEKSQSEAVLVAKEEGIIAGMEVFKQVFEILQGNVKFSECIQDGNAVKPGDTILRMKGNTRTILKGERLALNLLQRMSGIATLAKEYSDKVNDLETKVVDTRKTTPNLRILEKYAVRIGGCHNHRYNLSDAMMIKDNHIQAVGSITSAIAIGRRNIPHTMKIEVEVKNIDELKEALKAEADIIMLDNMSSKEMKSAVEMAKGKAILEASGGINLNNLREIALTGVDIISVGALTHSYKSLDISLLIK